MSIALVFLVEERDIGRGVLIEELLVIGVDLALPLEPIKIGAC